VVGRMWGQSRLPKNKWRTHSRGRRKEKNKKKKNGMTFGWDGLD
jgi:hypothetical protein